MSQKVDPVIHELAVLLASKQESGAVNPREIKRVYGNYLVAIKTLTALSEDEEFKANPFPPPKGKRRSAV